MVKQTAIAALALVALPVVADAQGVIVVPRPAPVIVEHVMVMSPPQPSPGDPGYGPAVPAPMATYPSQAMAPASTSCTGTIRDEYGRLYNCRGDQIGGPPPPVRPYSTRALRY